MKPTKQFNKIPSCGCIFLINKSISGSIAEMLTRKESSKVSMERHDLCLFFIKSNNENAVSHR